LKNLVCYSAQIGPDNYDRHLRQHLISVQSLRKHNPTIPVHLVVWGKKLKKTDIRKLEKLGVEIFHLGSCAKSLERFVPAPWARILAQFPLMHKWLTVEHVGRGNFEKILYLDNDTFFTRDVSQLFRRSKPYTIIAREEPMTSKSALGADPNHLDERALRKLMKSRGLKWVTPFNAGLTLLDKKSVRWLSRNLREFVHCTARFSISMSENSKFDMYHTRLLRTSGLARRSGNFEPLPYPSGNGWLLEEISLWMTLGKSPIRVRFFSWNDVMQGGEFMMVWAFKQLPCVIHYFSANTKHFQTAWIPKYKRDFET
jgi:lipopolysaccharide biosynthesis glycosyltransferase